MLQGAQELRWDPANPSKQYGNHYICLELRASHLHTPFFSLSHCLREVFRVLCGRSGLGVEVTDILLRGRWWANGRNAYLGFLEEGFDLQINLGLVIHNFLMPIKIGILGNQSVAVLLNLLENIENDSQASHLVCSADGWVPPSMPKLWSHYAQKEVLLHHAGLVLWCRFSRQHNVLLPPGSRCMCAGTRVWIWANAIIFTGKIVSLANVQHTIWIWEVSM